MYSFQNNKFIKVEYELIQCQLLNSIDFITTSNDTHIFQLKPIQTPSELKSKTWTRLSFHNSSYTMANTCDSNLGLLIACAEPKCGSQYAYHVRHKRGDYNSVSSNFLSLSRSVYFAL